MALSKSERRIMALSVGVSSYPRAAPTHTFSEVLAILHQRFKEGKATIVLSDTGTLPPYSEETDEEHKAGSDTRNAMYIADFDLDTEKNIAKVLVNRGDPDTPPQALINAVDKKVDITEIPEGYAPGNSAHIVFGFGEEHCHLEKYRAVLERSRGVSRSLIFSFFNQLLREASADLGYTYKTANRKESPYRPRMNALPYSGKTLQQDLKEGFVTSVELIDRSSDFAGLDAEGEVTSVSKRIRVGLRRTNNEQKLAGILGKLRTAAKIGDYDEIQINLGGLSNAAGTASPKFSLELEEAAEMVYGRIETLDGFPEDLEQAYAEICAPIVEKFVTRLSDDTKWPS